MSATTTRFSSIFIAPDSPVHILGAGAIGSMAALALAKSGFKTIHVYDFDDVAIENVGTQIYGVSHIGKPKVEALKEIIESLSESTVIPHHGRAENSVREMSGVIVVAFDSMAARKTIFKAIRVASASFTLYIDARMGAEELIVFAFDNRHRNHIAYNGTLLDDSETPPLPCTAKGTAYTSLFAGAHIMALIKKFHTEPFKFETVMHNIKTGELN